MTVKKVKARTAESARRKSKGKTITVTKVKRIKGSKNKKGMSTYNVTTRPKKKPGKKRGRK